MITDKGKMKKLCKTQNCLRRDAGLASIEPEKVAKKERHKRSRTATRKEVLHSSGTKKVGQSDEIHAHKFPGLPSL